MKPVQAVHSTQRVMSLMIAIYAYLYTLTKPFFRRRLRVGCTVYRLIVRHLVAHGIPTHVESSTEYTVQRIRMLGGRDRTRAGRVANACRAAARPATLMTM